MPAYDAVLFDWMLTLADYPGEREHLRRAHESIGRSVDDRELDRLIVALRTARTRPDVLAAAEREDCSADLHRSYKMLLHSSAGIDDTLSEAMYLLLGHPAFHPVYEGVEAVLEAIHAAGVKIAVVSDIHVDLREHARLAGFAGLIDQWILSFEHGVQKPDPEIFRIALDAVGTRPRRTLMVGDRASHDGAAASLGIDCLILPPCDDRTNQRLHGVLALLR
jgi:HAD superfamily hydrolase (TIGR01509 family)